ncbi:condensation domain-containing protein, partial [Streptomyces litchfieldiae]
MNDHSVIGTSPSGSPELAAIEDVVAAHPGISRAVGVLLAYEDDDGDAYELLVVYAVPAPGGPVPTEAEIRAHAGERQPGYAVPDVVVFLQDLPYTASGEVDRAALPPPRLLTGAGRAARTPQEELLCALFAAVLDVPGVGVDDDFFELGGHSLLATRLVSRVRSVMGLEVSVRDLFERPTVRALMEHGTRAAERTAPLVPAERSARVPASYSQQRMWFIEQLESTGSLYNVPLALRLSGRLDRVALERALADVVARHEALRTVYEESDGVLYQVIRDAADVIGTAVGLRVAAVPEAGLREALATEAARPFELGTQLPLRATLFEIGHEQHVLALVLHHIAVDGWSVGVVLRDVGVAYAARVAGRVPVWEVLPVQCA